jgi:hypothetical protein
MQLVWDALLPPPPPPLLLLLLLLILRGHSMLLHFSLREAPFQHVHVSQLGGRGASGRGSLPTQLQQLQPKAPQGNRFPLVPKNVSQG